MQPDLEFKRGAIELLILKTLSWGPRHGYAIARWIQVISDGHATSHCYWSGMGTPWSIA